eukprot:g45664.t1
MRAIAFPLWGHEGTIVVHHKCTTHLRNGSVCGHEVFPMPEELENLEVLPTLVGDCGGDSYPEGTLDGSDEGAGLRAPSQAFIFNVNGNKKTKHRFRILSILGQRKYAVSLLQETQIISGDEATWLLEWAYDSCIPKASMWQVLLPNHNLVWVELVPCSTRARLAYWHFNNLLLEGERFRDSIQCLVKVNGSLMVPLYFGRGVRQSCPRTSQLYSVCVEPFLRLLYKWLSGFALHGQVVLSAYTGDVLHVSIDPVCLWRMAGYFGPSPANFVTAIQKMLVKFFWDKRQHWVAAAFLSIPLEEGGQTLVCLCTQGHSLRYDMQFLFVEWSRPQVLFQELLVLLFGPDHGLGHGRLTPELSPYW